MSLLLQTAVAGLQESHLYVVVHRVWEGMAAMSTVLALQAVKSEMVLVEVVMKVVAKVKKALMDE